MIEEAQSVAERKGEARTQAERRDEAEHRILEAAAEIVAEGGFEAITLAEAGVRAGYSRGLPSHYFRTKGDLLSALGIYVVEAFLERHRANAGSAGGFEGLMESIRYYFQIPIVNPTIARAFQAVLASTLNTPAVAATIAQVNRNAVTEIAAGIRAGIAAGRLRDDIDPEMQAALILTTLRGSISTWQADPEQIDLRRLGAYYVATLEQSLAK